MPFRACYAERFLIRLSQVKSYGIQNILALRGDPPKGQETFTVVEGGFSCALDLVKYIRCTNFSPVACTRAASIELRPPD